MTQVSSQKKYYYADKNIELTKEHLEMFKQLKKFVNDVLAKKVSWTYDKDCVKLLGDIDVTKFKRFRRIKNETNEGSNESKQNESTKITKESIKLENNKSKEVLLWKDPIPKNDKYSKPTDTKKPNIFLAPPSFYEYLKTFADDECIIRHLTGSDYRLEVAKEAILSVCSWRVLCNIDNISPYDFKDSIEFKTLFSFGHVSYSGFPICYHIIAEKPPSDWWLLAQSTFLNSEKSIITAKKNNRQQCLWIIDLANFGYSTMAPMEVVRKISKAFQHYYPERLYKAFVVFAPFYFRIAWKLIQPLLTENTKSKVEVIGWDESSKYSTFSKYMKKEYLLKKYGGTLDINYNYKYEINAFENDWGIIS